jgi:hypothetical protein
MKQYTAMELLTTTGAGIAVGGTGVGGVLFGGAWRSATATTLTIKNSAGTAVFALSAEANVLLPIPVVINGPVTMTSSGGTPTVLFRKLSD